MTDKKRQRRNELDNLREDLGPYYHRPSPRPDSVDTVSNHDRTNSGGGGSGSAARTGVGGNTGSPGSNIMSQRNRSGRGSNRSNGNNSHGEEAQIWDSCKSQLAEIVLGINAENDNLSELVEMDKKVGAADPERIPNDSLRQMEQLCRNGVKFSEANVSSIKAVMEQLKIMRAVIVAKEQAEASSSAPTGKRNVRDSAAAVAASLYDFDGAGDSPVPSPIGGSSRKYGDRSSNRDRDSMPPKADGVEFQGSSGTGNGGGGSGSTAAASGASAAASAAAAAAAAAAVAASNKSKVVFSKGDAVAFKPRTGGEGVSDWIMGEVAQVLGEGKSRRYKVLDIEPEDQSKQKEYRTSASSMIPITPESQASTLKDWESGQVVLALYPNTTTFYKAEVHSMDSQGRVALKFEGENDSTTLQQVERRFVIEYRA
ncbi:SAGA complex subunit Sgf29 [Metarhizium album ARSEF 1941]|uniref:SAGA complex subunit Sgf29 n=1 Tax=Metarhizium album (strain ARSEF 1941) TaxID=1081103 RepID=A0A0B2WMZ2_METAS|nr:SAGA complex subunit Sgf29 [Metarhizium album ARSEF 1941]KHN94857.1 SAGA complex subunit Sgf29 [Metarhizium album ARSEF 1941]